MAGELQDSQGRGTVHRGLPRIHPDGRRFGLAALGLAGLFGLLAWETLAWPLAFLSLCIFAFFRDPERVVPQESDAILSPADGVIVDIGMAPPPAELVIDDGGDAPALPRDEVVRVGIAISLFDVHINRTPIAGVIRRVVYVPPSFAGFDAARGRGEQERQHILIEHGEAMRVGLTQIAGTFARRIVAFVKPGDILGAGQRVGLIRFGSRVDLYLPPSTGCRVILGQRVVAGETVIANSGDQPIREGVTH